MRRGLLSCLLGFIARTLAKAASAIKKNRCPAGVIVIMVHSVVSAILALGIIPPACHPLPPLGWRRIITSRARDLDVRLVTAQELAFAFLHRSRESSRSRS